MSPHIIGDERTRGSSGRDNRMFVEAVLWIVRTGSPWRDLPEVFGDWNSVFRRFRRWSHAGQKGDAPLADAAYDSDRLRKAIADKGAVAVIPNNPSRARKYKVDKHL